MPNDHEVDVAWRRSLPLAAFALAMMTAQPQALAARSGHFTGQQVSSGKSVYSGHCARCHGANLQGGAGPALQGSKFNNSLKYGNMSSKQLYSFIAKHMPKNDPGSLDKKQYLQVYAYLLSKNGFSAEGKALAESAIGKIKLLPLPDSGKGSGG